jgi:hypothetical protein
LVWTSEKPTNASALGKRRTKEPTIYQDVSEWLDIAALIEGSPSAFHGPTAEADCADDWCGSIESVTTPEAVDCILTEMASGEVAHFWAVASSSISSHTRRFYLPGDGTVIVQLRSFEDSVLDQPYPSRRILADESYFTDCLAETDPLDRWHCLEDCGGAGSEDSVDQCDEL